MRLILYNIITILMLTTCVTPVEVEIEEVEFLLVVEGFITTEPKSHLLQLAQTAKYGRVAVGSQNPVTRAFVAIRNDEGDLHILTEVTKGIYATSPNFAAEVGKSYSLLIETNTGKTYTSFPQKVLPVTEANKVFTGFKSRPSSNPFLSQSGLDIFVEFNDPVDQKNFYLWKLSGIYRVDSRPDLYEAPGEGRVPGVPTPKDCCNLCFVSEVSPQNFILSDAFFNGQNFTHKVAFLEDNGRRFMARYYMELEQLSITKEAFQHFTLVNNQLSINGSIFDPPPATIRGNMINTQDPTEETIGYFGAYDTRKFSMFLDLNTLEFRQRTIILNDDCLVLPFSTVIPPDFWY